MQFNVEINQTVIEQAEEICDNNNLSLDIAIAIMIKKIAKDQSISFLFNNHAQPESGTVSIDSPLKVQQPIIYKEAHMTKTIAKSLFEAKGIAISRNYTFASKNATAYNYWANPYTGMLKNDWYLILNDSLRRSLYLFIIPAGSINAMDMCVRNDKPDIIDLQIVYNDSRFTDSRSGRSFARFLKTEKTN